MKMLLSTTLSFVAAMVTGCNLYSANQPYPVPDKKLKRRVDTNIVQTPHIKVITPAKALDKELFFKVMEIVIKHNKKEIRNKIDKRIEISASVCKQHCVYRRWRNWGTECVHIIKFIKGAPHQSGNGYDYPFIAGYLHTAEVSYLFDRKRFEIIHKGERFELTRIFPNFIKYNTVLRYPYDGKDVESGVFDYTFEGVKYQSTT